MHSVWADLNYQVNTEDWRVSVERTRWNSTLCIARQPTLIRTIEEHEWQSYVHQTRKSTRHTQIPIARVDKMRNHVSRHFVSFWLCIKVWLNGQFGELFNLSLTQNTDKIIYTPVSWFEISRIEKHHEWTASDTLNHSISTNRLAWWQISCK